MLYTTAERYAGFWSWLDWSWSHLDQDTQDEIKQEACALRRNAKCELERGKGYSPQTEARGNNEIGMKDLVFMQGEGGATAS